MTIQGPAPSRPIDETDVEDTANLSPRPSTMATLAVADAAPLERAQPQPSTMATLSVADAFFLEELQATVGHREASAWLSSTRAKARSDRSHQGSSSASTTSSSTPLTRSLSPPQRRSDAGAAAGEPSRARLSYSPVRAARKGAKPHSPADAPSTSEDDERVKRVLRAGGRDAGLVFTDAAHCVYDVRA